jgi:hypothetical protein
VDALTDQHREILVAIGEAGADEGRLGWRLLRTREFGQLVDAKLIAFWHPYGDRPAIVSGTRGRWCLTAAGARAINLPLPALRIA